MFELHHLNARAFVESLLFFLSREWAAANDHFEGVLASGAVGCGCHDGDVWGSIDGELLMQMKQIHEYRLCLGREINNSDAFAFSFKLAKAHGTWRGKEQAAAFAHLTEIFRTVVWF